MNLDIYDPTNTTFLGTLAERHGVSFFDDLLIPGSATFTIDTVSTADLDLCAPRRVVRFRTGAAPGDGDVFAAIIQDRPAGTGSVEPPPGEAVSTVELECPGLLSWIGYSLGGGVLWPYGGLDGRQQNPRVFGWMAPDFDDTAWGSPITAGPLSTVGWPDPQAVAFQAEHPGGRALYRRYMPPGVDGAGPARMYVVATVDTEVTVWLDSDVVIEKPAGKTGLFTADVPYEDIEHLVAIDAVGGVGRVGLSWIKLETTTDEHGNEAFELGDVLRRSFDPADFPSADSDWMAYQLESPDDPHPGVTVGYVAATALGEDDDRNGRPWSWDFDADEDSAGQTWDLEFTRGFRVQELGRLLDELTSIEGEPHMTPAGAFQLHKARGQDRTGTVSITYPFDLALTGRGPQATRWLYETSGGFGQAINEAAETELGVVMEQFVQLGTDIAPGAIGPALVKQLAEDGGTLDEIEVDLPDDVTPYVDVHLGDKVTCVARNGSVSVRLTSFEFEELDTGDHVWRATAVPA